MGLDVLMLSRLQFAANISFHILFPTVSIGLSLLLVYFRIRYTLSRDQAWEYAYLFWVKVFALTFALGVVSGITMSFQFGTNWPGFMERAGNIAGPLLGYEVLTAFFLEASFLGIMLYGKDRVSNRVHLVSSSIVAVGTCLSAFWILALNSWMQTPDGYILKDGVFYIASWWRAIFNPSFPYRFAHMINASLLTVAFIVVGISAWRVRAKVDGPATWMVVRTGIFLAAITAPLQVFLGDSHGLNTLEHQPAKIAAVEALWKTEKGAPLTLFGFPDEKSHTTHLAIKVPHLASVILTHHWDGELKGIENYPDAHPPVELTFWSFRVMVGVGLLMWLVAWWGAYQLLRRDGLSPWVLRILSWMTFSGWIAVLAGWYVSEIGRQPYMVYGLLRIDQVVAQHPPSNVLVTFVAYLALYIFLLISYIGALRYLSGKPAQSLSLVQGYRSRVLEAT